VASHRVATRCTSSIDEGTRKTQSVPHASHPAAEGDARDRTLLLAQQSCCRGAAGPTVTTARAVEARSAAHLEAGMELVPATREPP